mgnify:CR=1 FL=1
MAERRTTSTDHSHRPSGNGSIWKPIAIALISIVATTALGLWMLSRGTATQEQVREARGMSQAEIQALAATTKEAVQKLAEIVKALDDQLKAVTREQDRRGGRLEKLDDTTVRLEGRMVAIESVQGVIAKFSVELRVLQENQGRLEALLRELNDRLQRRLEPPEPPRGKMPRGFP